MIFVKVNKVVPLGADMEIVVGTAGICIRNMFFFYNRLFFHQKLISFVKLGIFKQQKKHEQHTS